MVERTNVQAFIFTKEPYFKVLILKRTPERSGYWQPACGGVDRDESPKETVIREAFEETGLYEDKILNIIDLEYSFSYKETKNGKLMNMQDICFAVEVSREFNVELSDEHEEFKWCTENEAKEYLEWEHNLIALDKLLEKVQASS